MRFVALVSGGKDSVFSLGKCLAHGHELVCLANLYPPDTGPEELDSFMFQSAGATALEALAECLGVPLLRAPLRGRSGHQGLHYAVTEGDEVEDLYELLRHVKETYPDVQAVASGAVLSTYQRTRVESVCERLGLQSLAFLWQYDQSVLLEEMVANGMEAVLVKVASQGLMPHKHLGKSIAELTPVFQRLKAQYGFHVAGEGGEYETLTLDAPFFKRRLVLDRTEVVIHSDDLYAPVGLLRVLQCHTEPKPNGSGGSGGGGGDGDPLAALVLPPAGARLLAAAEAAEAAKAVAAQAAAPSSKQEQQQQPSPLTTAVLPTPRVWRQGRQLFVAGFACATPPSPSSSSTTTTTTNADPPAGAAAARQVTLLLSALDQALAAEGSSLADVVFVHLYLRDVAAAFGPANAAYCAAPFLAAHPPSRSCVEAPLRLPPGAEVMLDAWALQGSGAAMLAGQFRDRQVLHVKSRSAWAPLCIGPYSQANLLAHGHLALLAGQIGLDPATMALVQATSPDLRQLRLEACQALHNCAAVLAALRSSLRAAAMVVVYVNLGAGDSVFSCEAATAEWRRACLGNAGYGRRRQQQQQQHHHHHHVDDGGGSRRRSGSDSDSSEDESDEEDEEEALLALAAGCPFLVVGVPGLPRGAKVEFEVVALSRMLAGTLAPATDAWTVEGTAAAASAVASNTTSAVDNPLPEPFQPPLPALQQAPPSPSSPFTIAAETLHLPSALLTLHLSLRLPPPPTSPSQPPPFLLIDYPALAATAVAHVRRALAAAALEWRQLSRLRFFYTASGGGSGSDSGAVVTMMIEEPLLREAVAGALPPEAQGVARTFVPVSSLLISSDGGQGLLRVQALALDLERLRTEAWVHEVPDGGI